MSRQAKNPLQALLKRAGRPWTEADQRQYILEYCPIAHYLGVSHLDEARDTLDCKGCKLCNLDSFSQESDTLTYLERVLVREKGEQATLADIDLLNSKLTFTPMIIHNYKTWDDVFIDSPRQEKLRELNSKEQSNGWHQYDKPPGEIPARELELRRGWEIENLQQTLYLNLYRRIPVLNPTYDIPTLAITAEKARIGHQSLEKSVSDDRYVLRSYGMIPTRRKLDPIERQQIINKYKSNRSINSIANEYQVDRKTIRELLKEQGVYRK
ncbi:MAG: hypothetical protein ACTSV7_14410 [Candidatus Baldrarchaeia archaeon]